MRLKVVIGILLLGTALLVIIVLTSKMVHPQSTVSLAENTAVSVPPTNSVKTVSPAVATPQPVFYTTPVVATNDPAAHEKYVRQRIKELDALAMNNDTESRDIILSEVATNSDRRIRAAALEAAIQFDDRSVVPPLQAIAAQTDDPEEKQSILDAIDYINLPSLSEYLAANPPDPSAPPNPNVQKHPHRTKAPPSDSSPAPAQP
jgi:hypothetical protein